MSDTLPDTLPQTLYAQFAAHVADALDALVASGALPAGLNRGAVTVEPPRDLAHGDLATNAAMVLARPAGTNPRALAEALVAELTKLDTVTEASVAGPGFINLRLSPAAWLAELRAVAALGADYGKSKLGAGARVNLFTYRSTRLNAIAGARWSAMRWPLCWNFPVIR